MDGIIPLKARNTSVPGWENVTVTEVWTDKRIKRARVIGENGEAYNTRFCFLRFDPPRNFETICDELTSRDHSVALREERPA